MNYQKISDELKARIAAIPRPPLPGQNPSLEDKFTARKALVTAISATDYPFIAKRAGSRVVPLCAPLSFSELADAADAIERGRDGMMDYFGDDMTGAMIDY
ncbi:hypothetical protein [Pseudomonas fluorescens]|uniref:hypothetical protein n=1 Tax=Pseudomonas fluorescens TaxID=294 RepID=UPI000370E0BB|nr:hypothetical protein [Pseudomonas fluorescens]